MELRGATALVTGAGHRVGRAIALGLAGAGSNIVLHFHRSRDAADGTAAEVGAMGVEVATVSGDLGLDPAGVFAAAPGPVRILVNSAAVFPEDRLRDVTRAEWERTLAVNLTGPVFLTQAFAQALPDDVDGAVVNISDWRTERPYPDHFSYTIAKG